MSGSMANLFRSERLLYRAIEDDDEEFMHAIQSDTEAYANSSSGLLVPETKAHSKKWKTGLLERALVAAIVCLPGSADPSSGEETNPTRIGVIALDGGGAPHHRNAYIAIDIKAGFRGKGYGGEAIRWILDWGFRAAGLHRIGIETFSWNEGACRLYERLGFVFEGRKRHLVWYNGGWGDYLSYSMLEDEWKALKDRGDAKQEA